MPTTVRPAEKEETANIIQVTTHKIQSLHVRSPEIVQRSSGLNIMFITTTGLPM